MLQVKANWLLDSSLFKRISTVIIYDAVCTDGERLSSANISSENNSVYHFDVIC